MSLAEVTARIDQIKQQLDVYLGAAPDSAANGTEFANALDSATARTSLAAGSTTDVTASQQAVLDEAEKYLGVPYVWGGTDPSKGLDCSGFVQLVYGNLGYDLPRVSRDQATVGTKVEGGLANAQPGDLLAFGSPVDHIAIYVGDGKMIEAPHRGADVRIADVWDTPVAIRRILPEGNDPSAQLIAAQRSFLSAYSSSPGSNTGLASWLGNASGLLGTDALQGLTGMDALSTAGNPSNGRYLSTALGTL